MFLGEFEHSIDDKGRITIPAKFRGRLAAGVVITRAIDRCLLLYPIDVWEVLAQKISALPQTAPNARELRRQMFGGASDLIPDKQGRVNLPPYLREYANIDSNAVIIGMYDYCEIWNPEDWRGHQQQSLMDPEARAERFAGLEI
jgi:MraZ protein